MKKINKQFFFDVMKTVLIALIFSSVFILGLSLLIGFVPLDGKVLVAVNQGVKVISLLLASLLCFKEKSKGAIKGILIGLIYSLLSWLLFGTVQDSLNFTLSTLIDVSVGAVMGLICGCITVLFGKKSTQA